MSGISGMNVNKSKSGWLNNYFNPPINNINDAEKISRRGAIIFFALAGLMSFALFSHLMRVDYDYLYSGRSKGTYLSLGESSFLRFAHFLGFDFKIQMAFSLLEIILFVVCGIVFLRNKSLASTIAIVFFLLTRILLFFSIKDIMIPVFSSIFIFELLRSQHGVFYIKKMEKNLKDSG